MALIVGSITGVGIFNLPTSLAFYGLITLVSMALTTVGARGAARRDCRPHAARPVSTGGEGGGGRSGREEGWTTICAEMPLAAPNDGLFPERFTRMSKNGVSAFGVIASTVLASAAMIINYLVSNGATVFTTRS